MNKLTTLGAMALALTFAPLRAGENCSFHDEAKAGKGDIQKTEIKTGGKDKAYYHNRFPEISQADLIKAMDQKAVFLVDANGTESYSSGHIPGAVHFQGSVDKLAEMLPKEKDALIVAYCGGPRCQAWCKAADKLDQMGYSNVRHYKGGIKEWKSAGRAVATPSKG